MLKVFHREGAKALRHCVLAVKFFRKITGNNGRTRRLRNPSNANVHRYPMKSESIPLTTMPMLDPIFAIAIRMENIDAAIRISVTDMEVAKKAVS